MELLLPKVRAPVPKLPSYEVLNMAFGVGAGALLFDKSIYRSHGAITTATWAAGLHGYCLDFNSANPDYVVIPAAHTQLNFQTESFSIIARVYVDDFTINHSLFIRGLINADGYDWFLHTVGRSEFRTHQALASQTSRSLPGSILINTWYTLGISRSGASVRTLIDGVDATAVVGVHINPLTSARDAKIGVWDNLIAQPYDGRIEFLRVFRGIALTTSEHLAWHNALA